MAKRFQHLCASSRIMKPLCKHLSFDKVAICAKKVKLAQVGIELGPDDGLECNHFLSVDAQEPEETKQEKKNKSKKNKKKSSSKEKEKNTTTKETT